jgi:hypothetical protein
MRRVITSPENYIWLDNITDVYQHCLKSLRWHVALILTPFASFSLWFCWKTIFLSAAEKIIAILISTGSVLVINMHVSEKHCLELLAALDICYPCILLVEVFIVHHFRICCLLCT